MTDARVTMTQVGALSRALAIRTLQLELEYIYGCLEDEALDIGQGTQNPSFLLSRQVTAHATLCVFFCSTKETQHPSLLPSRKVSRCSGALWTQQRLEGVDTAPDCC